jgi:CheY-like chemotaxis protein
MLGQTSYQEALRAIGRLAGSTPDLGVVEHPESGSVEVITSNGVRCFSAEGLEELVVASLARRGEHRAAGDVSDVLRSVGLALDELHALHVRLTLSSERLQVRFADRRGAAHELSYADDELDALRRAAAARRNGQPLRRILILQADPALVALLVETLVTEFAVQALPTAYARAVAATSEPPDLVLAQVCAGTLDAVRTLRSGAYTADVPILALAGAEGAIDAHELFAAGADDLLQEPVQPAQLRARIRTSLLRARPVQVAQAQWEDSDGSEIDQPHH